MRECNEDQENQDNENIQKNKEERKSSRRPEIDSNGKFSRK